MNDKKDTIISLLGKKSVTKQVVYHNTLNVFNELKSVIEELSQHLKQNIKNFEKEVKIGYKDKGLFEAELTFGGDALIFSMHTNVFHFSKDHAIYENEYVKSNQDMAYCGVIHIYNFLADSLKYNRQFDSGHLIGRIFINKEYGFFIEGKHQLGFNFQQFGKQNIGRNELNDITQSAIIYTLNFDLITQPYGSVQDITVLEKIQQAGLTAIKTSKRMGFRFNAESSGK